MSIKIPPKTIQIQWSRKNKSFTGRLSPDLVTMAAKDETFAWDADNKSKKLTLDSKESLSQKIRLKVWGSNHRARSGYIGMTSVFKELGIDYPKKLIGKTFDVEVTGNRIEVQF